MGMVREIQSQVATIEAAFSQVSTHLASFIGEIQRKPPSEYHMVCAEIRAIICIRQLHMFIEAYKFTKLISTDQRVFQEKCSFVTGAASLPEISEFRMENGRKEKGETLCKLSNGESTLGKHLFLWESSTELLKIKPHDMFANIG